MSLKIRALSYCNLLVIIFLISNGTRVNASISAEIDAKIATAVVTARKEAETPLKLTISEQAQQITTLTAGNTELSRRLAETQRLRTETVGQAEALRREKSALTERCRGLTVQIRGLVTDKATLQTRIERLTTEQRTLVNQTAELRIQIGVLERSQQERVQHPAVMGLGVLAPDAAEIQARFQRALDKWESEKQELIAAKGLLTREFEESSARNEQIARESATALESSQSDLREARQQLVELEGRSSGSEATIGGLREALARASAELESNRGELESKTSQITGLEENLIVAEGRLQELSEILAGAQLDLAAKTQTIMELERTVAESQATMAALEERLSATSEELVAKELELRDKEREYAAELEKLKQEAEDQLVAHAEQLSAFPILVRTKSTELSSLKQSNAALARQLEETIAASDRKDEQFAALQASSQQSNGAMERLSVITREKQLQDERVIALEADLQRINEELNKLREEAAQKYLQNAALETRVQSLPSRDAEMDELRRQLDAVRGEKQEQVTLSAGFEAELQRMTAVLDGVSSESAGKDTQYAELQARIQSIQSENDGIDALTRQLEAVRGEKQQQDGRVAALEAELRSVDAELERVKSEAAGKDTQYAELEASMQELRSIADQVSELRSQLAAEREAKQVQDERVVGLEADLQRIEASLKKSETQIAELLQDPSKRNKEIRQYAQQGSAAQREALEDNVIAESLVTNFLDTIKSARQTNGEEISLPAEIEQTAREFVERVNKYYAEIYHNSNGFEGQNSDANQSYCDSPALFPKKWKASGHSSRLSSPRLDKPRTNGVGNKLTNGSRLSSRQNSDDDGVADGVLHSPAEVARAAPREPEQFQGVVAAETATRINTAETAPAVTTGEAQGADTQVLEVTPPGELDNQVDGLEANQGEQPNGHPADTAEAGQRIESVVVAVEGRVPAEVAQVADAPAAAAAAVVENQVAPAAPATNTTAPAVLMSADFAEKLATAKPLEKTRIYAKNTSRAALQAFRADPTDQTKSKTAKDAARDASKATKAAKAAKMAIPDPGYTRGSDDTSGSSFAYVSYSSSGSSSNSS